MEQSKDSVLIFIIFILKLSYHPGNSTNHTLQNTYELIQDLIPSLSKTQIIPTKTFKPKAISIPQENPSPVTLIKN